MNAMACSLIFPMRLTVKLTGLVLIIQFIQPVPAKTKDLWTIHETQGFNIYHHPEDASLASEAADILESEFNRVTDLLGFIPAGKSTLYLITDHSAGMSIPKSENRHAVHLGQDNMKTDLIFTWTGVLLDDMFGSRTVKKFPFWYCRGIMAYLAGVEVSREQVDNTLFNPDILPGLDRDRSQVAGKLIWEYLVKMNGQGIIAPILNISRINKATRDAIEEVTDVSFDNLMTACAKYYLQS